MLLIGEAFEGDVARVNDVKAFLLGRILKRTLCESLKAYSHWHTIFSIEMHMGGSLAYKEYG